VPYFSSRGPPHNTALKPGYDESDISNRRPGKWLLPHCLFGLHEIELLLAASETGGYIYQQIGDDFGAYFTTLVPFDITTGNRREINR
jgi:hypothetical protein